MVKPASLGLLIALLWPAAQAKAVPYVYTDTVLGISDLSACVDNAKRVAAKNGFSADMQVLGNGKHRDIYASHDGKALSLAVSCSVELGAASIAVAGMNNNDAFAFFKQVYADF
jgi:hypothetical protein